MKNIGELVHSTAKVRPSVCPKHGNYDSRCFICDTWTGCPACEDEQKELAAKQSEASSREAKRAAWERRTGGAGIPERFKSKTLDTFVTANDGQRKALSFCRGYADDFDKVIKTGRSAIFSGRPGTGKTHLAIGIALRIMGRDNRTAMYTTVSGMVLAIRDTWTKNNQMTTIQAIEMFATPDLLILDEIGLQSGTANEHLLIFDVLDGRYRNQLPTLLLSNLNLDDVKVAIGERIYDRFREDGGKYMPFDWESWRSNVDQKG